MNNQLRYREISNTYPISVFAQDWWLDVVCPGWNAAIAAKGDMVSGVLPYLHEQKLGVDIWRTPVFTPYLGPQVFYPKDMKAQNKDSHMYETLGALYGQLPQFNYANIALEPGMKHAGFFQEQGFEIHARQTFILPLQGSEQELLAGLKESTRRNIKLAMKEITVANEPDALPELVAMYLAAQSRRQRNTDITLSFVQQLFGASVSNNAGALWVARQEGKIAGALWHIWDNNKGYPIMSAQHSDSANYTIMAALHWHAIIETKKMNIPAFDFEGSMDAGVERFYRSFGGERELYMVLRRNNSLLWNIKERLF